MASGPTTNATANAFPQLNTPFVELSNGNIQIPWYRLLIALWNRTGGANGAFVTRIDTGNGLQGGPITSTGTISLAQMPAFTLKGNATASLADPTDLTASEVKGFLDFVGVGDLAGGDLSGSYPNPTIALNAVTNSKLDQMPALTLKGNNTGLLADPLDLTVSEVQDMLGINIQVDFFASLSANQNMTTGVASKVHFDSILANDGGYYDGVTNFRFLPSTAGLYLVTLQITGFDAGAGGVSQIKSLIYKNGASYAVSQNLYPTTVTAMVHLNGTTDYIEGWAQVDATTPQTQGGTGPFVSFFQAHRIGT